MEVSQYKRDNMQSKLFNKMYEKNYRIKAWNVLRFFNSLNIFFSNFRLFQLMPSTYPFNKKIIEGLNAL